MPATKRPDLEAQIRGIMRKSPLYTEGDQVLLGEDEIRCYETPYGRFSIMWGEPYRGPQTDHNHFAIEIDPRESTGYLLFVTLRPELRGQGLGWQIYQLAEEIIRLFGCRRYEMTPSGWTFRGEPRAAWLERRGFMLQDDIAFKPLEY